MDPSLYETVDEDGVFHIYSLKDLRRFLYYVREGHENLDAVLENDVDMEGKLYIGFNYRGHFDGRGYAISHTQVCLFTNLQETARVENLHLKDVNITEIEEIGSGGVAYHNYGEIINCQVSGMVRGCNYTGGIAAVNFGLIKDCVNYADIVSTETGETFVRENWTSGYGAGGIAGLSGTSRREKDLPKQCAIINCVNRGSVTAQALSGGICAYMNDKTNDGDGPYKHPEVHFSMINCKNYGTVTVEQMVRDGYSTSVAGICGELHYGDLYHCANLGKVRFSENANKVSESGRAYSNKPIAVTYHTGLSPAFGEHIIDCVNVKGSIEDAMRHENIMEITEEELELWEEGRLPYVSNNWRFQLDEAIRLCSLSPLGVEESDLSADDSNYYLCNGFAIKLPEGFQIEEVYEDGVCYALHISMNKEEQENLPEGIREYVTPDFETWLMRKEADIAAAFLETGKSNTKKLEGYFMQSVYETLPNIHMLKIASLNLPFYRNYTENCLSGRRIFIENAIPFGNLDSYMKEENHTLGNVIAMPLVGNIEDGLAAEWILLMTNNENNIHPTREYVDLIENGFYPLDGSETVIRAKEGDNLWRLAEKYTGNGVNWKMLADVNNIKDPDFVRSGASLIVPDRELWEKKASYINRDWFTAD